jgi:hypothetical protein
MRFKLPPGGDVPASVAARRLGLSLEQFGEVLPELLGRGFPAPDPTTGNYCSEAMDVWRLQGRFPHLFSGILTAGAGARDAKSVVRERIRGWVT